MGNQELIYRDEDGKEIRIIFPPDSGLNDWANNFTIIITISNYMINMFINRDGHKY